MWSRGATPAVSTKSRAGAPWPPPWASPWVSPWVSPWGSPWGSPWAGAPCVSPWRAVRVAVGGRAVGVAVGGRAVGVAVAAARHRGGMNGLDGGLDRPAAFVPEHEDERCAEVLDGVLDAREFEVAERLARGPHDEEISDALIEENLRGDARVCAAHDDRKGILTAGDRRTAIGARVGALDPTPDEPSVALLQAGEGFVGPDLARPRRDVPRGRTMGLRAAVTGRGVSGGACPAGACPPAACAAETESPHASASAAPGRVREVDGGGRGDMKGLRRAGHGRCGHPCTSGAGRYDAPDHRRPQKVAANGPRRASVRLPSSPLSGVHRPCPTAPDGFGVRPSPGGLRSRSGAWAAAPTRHRGRGRTARWSTTPAEALGRARPMPRRPRRSRPPPGSSPSRCPTAPRRPTNSAATSSAPRGAPGSRRWGACSAKAASTTW
jgi:hypothetical protein